jgi:hypothetical protein
MKQTELAAVGTPRQRQRRWIVFICAALGAGMGFVLSFHPIALDAFEFHDLAGVYEDEQGRTHVELVGSAVVRVFGVKVFSQERVFSHGDADWDLSDRWRRCCQLISVGLTVVGFAVGASFGLCLQRLTQRRKSTWSEIRRLQGASSATVQPPSV